MNVPELPPVKGRKPCNECPYRKGTKFNGGSPPEVYIGQAYGPYLLSCHLSPGYFANPRDPSHLQCAGAAIFRANIERDTVMPPKMLRLPKDTEVVFETPAEMFAHHRRVSLARAEAILHQIPPEAMLQAELRKLGNQPVRTEDIPEGT